MFKVLFDWTALDEIVEILDEHTITPLYNAYRRTTSKVLRVAVVAACLEALLTTGVYVLTIGRLASQTQLLVAFLFMSVYEILHSYLVNRYLFFRDEILTTQIIPKIQSSLTKRNLTQEIIRSFSLVVSRVSTYHLGLMKLIRDASDFASFVLVCVFLVARGETGFAVAGMAVYLLIVIVAGGIFRSSSKRLTSALNSGDPVNPRDLIIRVSAPSITNVGAHVLLRFLTPYILLSGQFTVQLLLGLLTNLVVTLWDSVNFTVRISEAGKNLLYARDLLRAVECRYIINNRGYLRQKQRCDIKRRGHTSGLTLRKFRPIADSSTLGHVYTATFAPGIYQLNGANGVGKTTLLKSLTIPENYATMYSKGKVAFDGNCLYIEPTLAEHREKFVYIGHLSTVPPVVELPAEDAKRYPLIAELHQQVIARNSPHLSEGEQNVVLIYRKFTDAAKMGTRLIAIDEALSRIYNGADKPLRAETLKFIAEKTKRSPGLVTIFVDHQTKVRYAKQRLMTKNEIR